MAGIYVLALARRQLRNSISTSLNLMDEQRNGYIQMKLTIQVKKDYSVSNVTGRQLQVNAQRSLSVEAFSLKRI